MLNARRPVSEPHAHPTGHVRARRNGVKPSSSAREPHRAATTLAMAQPALAARPRATRGVADWRAPAGTSEYCGQTLPIGGGSGQRKLNTWRATAHHHLRVLAALLERSLFAAAKGTNMMMVVAVLEGICSFLAAETWLRTGPRPTMMDTELHAAGGYVCLPHNRYRSHVVQSRGLQLAAAEAAQQRNYPPQGPSRGSSQLWCMTSDRHVVRGRPLENSISYRNMAF